MSLVQHVISVLFEGDGFAAQATVGFTVVSTCRNKTLTKKCKYVVVDFYED